MQVFLGCDLGGTNIKVGLVDIETGSVLIEESRPTLAKEGHDAVLKRMASLMLDVINNSNIQKEQIGGIGIGAPGVLDLEKGTVLFLPNLPGNWRNVPARDTIQRLVGLPVYLINDVRSITLGEWKFGAGRGVETMACYAIGTGIGGGLVINGRLHLGIGGTAGELGHQIIDYNGPRCGCGNYGCLETYASGPAIAAMGVKAVMQGLTTCIGEMVNYDLNKITPKVIANAAQKGDFIANNIFEQAGAYLGYAIANTLVSISPNKIVIAGGVAQAGDLLLNPIRKTIRERVTVMPVDQVEIVLAKLGINAGIVGTALWASLKGYQQ